MAHIVIINPRFETSYWGMEHALPLFDAKANLPVACLPLLAALTPAEHTITLVDENVEPIDFGLCEKADIVALTGMIVQRFRMTEILTELKRRECFTVVGGPWVTVKEDYFGNLVDVCFIGEAEETWPRFLDEWEQGSHARRYEQSDKTDMSKVPVPRFDLLKMDQYARGAVLSPAISAISSSSSGASRASRAAPRSSPRWRLYWRLAWIRPLSSTTI